MKHYKTTIAGALLAAVTSITAIVNYHELSPGQLMMIAGFAIAQFMLGLWAHDPPKDA